MKQISLYSLIMVLLSCCVVEASQEPQSNGVKDIVPVHTMSHSESRHQLRHYPPIDSGLTVRTVVDEHKESQQAEVVNQDDSVKLVQLYDEYLAIRRREEEVKQQVALYQALPPFAGQVGLRSALNEQFYKNFFSALSDEKQKQEEKREIRMWENMQQDLLNWYLQDVTKAYRALRKYFPRNICDLIILSTYGVRIHHRS